MNIYLIRHGEAEPADVGKLDSDRRLTIEGIKIVRACCNLWKNFISSFDYVISSPLTRAVQTAEIIHSAFKVKNEIIKDRALLNGSETIDILDLVKSVNCENAALIGHQPDLSYHLSKLIFGKETEYKIRPCTIIKVSFNGKIATGKGVLEFFIPPLEK